MRITQSTSVGGLNPDWLIDCEAREMAGSSWSVEETRALLNLWGEDRVQRQLQGAVRNKGIFEGIQRALASLGYQRTWLQCRVKVKNLIAMYRKIKDNNNRSGQGRSNFVFYDLLDRVLGTRPPSRPTNLLSSSPAPPTATQPNPNPPAQDSESAHEVGERHQTIKDNEVEEEEDREDQESSPHGQNEDDSNDGGEAQEEETTDDSDTTSSVPTITSTPGRTTAVTTSTFTSTPSNSGIRRKRTEADRRISEVMEQLQRQTQESDRRFIEFEEKRMKVEAENEERRAALEEDRMMRMQQLFMQQMQQMMMMFTGYGPPPFPYPPVSMPTSLSQPSTPRKGQPSQLSDDCP